MVALRAGNPALRRDLVVIAVVVLVIDHRNAVVEEGGNRVRIILRQYILDVVTGNAREALEVVLAMPQGHAGRGSDDLRI